MPSCGRSGNARPGGSVTTNVDPFPWPLPPRFSDLQPDEQVLAFRILPRRLATAVFEYMPRDAQRALVKAIWQQDVAALLNNTSPDNRTWFLSELPANVTEQLLALLTDEERAEAVTSCATRSARRALMTPHDIAVRYFAELFRSVVRR